MINYTVFKYTIVISISIIDRILEISTYNISFAITLSNISYTISTRLSFMHGIDNTKMQIPTVLLVRMIACSTALILPYSLFPCHKTNTMPARESFRRYTYL